MSVPALFYVENSPAFSKHCAAISGMFEVVVISDECTEKRREMTAELVNIGGREEKRTGKIAGKQRGTDKPLKA